MRRVLLLTCLFLPTLTGAALAGFQPNHGDSLPPIHAVRLDGPVTIDGALTEPAWQRAPSSNRLVQGDPVEGVAASESTWVWLAFDEQALYVAARMWDSHPDSIIANLVRRDGLVASDRFLILLDPYHDHRTGYYFSVNAAGVLRDGTLLNDTWNEDTWDGVWEGRARRDDRGWTCELRLPFSQLRYRAGAEQVWGVNLRRRIERRSEENYTVYSPKDGSGYVSRFAHLAGLEPGARSRSVELVPYTTGKAEYLVHDAGDPFREGGRYKPAAGVDLRTGIGNNLTLNATVNPDFGQVEVDPAVVNLSDVESYFSEKRPFFTENSGIFSNFGQEGASNYWGFNWSNPRFFYTRRIGRGPQGPVPDGADFSDVPMATRILGAAKLTGRLGPGLSFGTMNALTSSEDARIQRGGLESRAQVEPLTWYSVTRGLKESKGGANGLGAMVTLAQRDFGGGGLHDALNRQSFAGGLDGWHFLDQDRVWVVSGWAAMTRVAGTPARMVAVQRDSRHYLQRPDVDYLGVDSSATSLTGWGGRLVLNKEKGNWISNSSIGVISPKFDVADVGYLSRTDQINAHAGLGYKWTKPNAWRRYANVIGAVFQTRDFGGVPVWEGVWGDVEATFVNDWSMSLNGAWNPSMTSDRGTRGGPRMRTLDQGELGLYATTDGKRRLSYELNAYTSGSTGGNSRSVSLNPYVAWKPASNFTLSAGPGYDHTVEDAMYVTQAEAPGRVPEGFGDRRYVFARLDQRTVSANLRLDLSFTPNLSLQGYLQPLVSTGTYSDYKELARAGSREFVHYGDAAVPTPDGIEVVRAEGDTLRFGDPSGYVNCKSLRGNAVLRWEYRPGSVLYLVWTQTRDLAFEPAGGLRVGPAVRRLFDARTNDIFLVKLTYHLSL